MPVAPIPLPPDHFGVDQYNVDQPGTQSGSWEAILADPVGSPGATYDPRVWVKYDAATWRRIPPFSSAALNIGIYIKDSVNLWRFIEYSGGYPTEPVPMKFYVRT